MEPGDTAAYLQRLRLTDTDAQTRKGREATNKPSRQELMLFFSKQAPSMTNAGKVTRTCSIPFAYPPSTTPLANLDPINISDLRLETHHHGKVLLIRAFGYPRRFQAVHNAVEDADGDVDRLVVYNEDPSIGPEQLLPKDAIFAVKEPFYRTTAEGGYAIRVDHPSDIVLLQPTDTSVPAELIPRVVEYKSASDWKNEGNAAYLKKDYLIALDLYSRGIAACEQEDDAVYDLLRNKDVLKCHLLRNRAAVNLLLKRYERAQADAEASITPELTLEAAGYNNKAFYRAGRSAYELRNFAEANQLFAKALALTPDDEESMNEHKRTVERLREETTGVYDFVNISSSASQKNNRLDHASFTSNVQVRQAGSRGRGLFATKDIKAGDLIFCEKAFSIVFGSDKLEDHYIITNMNSGFVSLGGDAYLFLNLIQKLRHNPDQATRFLSLHDGGYTPKCTAEQVDGATVIDIMQTRAIIEHNCFGGVNVRPADSNLKTERTAPGSVGIWIVASYANHACDGNARRTYIGDLMIVGATRDIAKDDEIRMPYQSPYPNNEKTVAELQTAWGFTCDCAICIAERKTSDAHRKLRKKLIKKTKLFLSAHKQSTDYRPNKATTVKAEHLYSKIEETYDEQIFNHVPRLGLVGLGNWLCQAYSTPSTIQECGDNAMKLLRDLGFAVSIKGKVLTVDRSAGHAEIAAMDAANYAAHAHFYQNNKAIAKQFEAFAKEMYRVWHGELRGFEDRYGGVML